MFELNASGVWTQLGNDLDGEAAGDQSGMVSLSGDGSTVAIGAGPNDGNGTNSGHVRVYKFDASMNVWIQKGSDIDGESGDFSGIVSLNYNGSRVAIGALVHDNWRGRVRVYEYTMNAWHQLGSDFVGSSAAQNEEGIVALNDDCNRLAIGAQGYSTSRVRVFEYDTSTSSWTQLGASMTSSNTYFGTMISMNGNGTRIAVSSIAVPGGGPIVQIFEFNTTDWTQMGSTLQGMASSLNEDGSQVAIGFPSQNTANVYEFDSAVSDWTKLGGDMIGEVAGDNFGDFISLSGDGTRVAIASLVNDRNTGDVYDNGGHVRVYELS